MLVLLIEKTLGEFDPMVWLYCPAIGSKLDPRDSYFRSCNSLDKGFAYYWLSLKLTRLKTGELHDQ